MGDAQWSNTGDRYLVSLFRDRVFHAAQAAAPPPSSSAAALAAQPPFIDLAFVLDELNRCDVGSAEKLMLQSRDGDALLIVRYADIARSITQAMHELQAAQQSQTTLPPPEPPAA
jgi:PAB-dependent poly(A)-specific ribonuclease subunit 3